MNSRIENDPIVVNSKLTDLVTRGKELGYFVYGRIYGMDFWYSPQEFLELAKKQSEWIKKITWCLRDPRERCSELEGFIDLLNQELKDIKTVIYLEQKEKVI